MDMDRRDFLKFGMSSFAAGVIRTTAVTDYAKTHAKPRNFSHSIDRKALVNRHIIKFDKADVMNTLSVGNGDFAYGVDITGLQSFEDDYNGGIPLSTMSHWGWHDQLTPKGYSSAEYPETLIKSPCGREVPYLMVGKTPELADEANFLYGQTTRINLGKVGLVLTHEDGSSASLKDLTGIHQTLDLWTGMIDSRFTFDEKPVHVQTCCHGEKDQIGIRIDSPLISSGSLKVIIAFPYASNAWNTNGADWSHPDAYETRFTRAGNNRADFHCILDATQYYASMIWQGKSEFIPAQPHHYLLQGENKQQVIEFIASFSQNPLPHELPNFGKTKLSSRSFWRNFWMSGAAIDLSESKDDRWMELERRIVLSQYLTRINCSGLLPPQETGLTCNSWYGKFHLEMHWWHAAHFALWGRSHLLERSLPFYQKILPAAKARAKNQGFQGARWPKSCGPSGYQAPQGIEASLLWQQPHQMAYAELAYQAHPDHKTLELYKEIVFQTADFLASFACRPAESKWYQLGPPVCGAAEVYHDYAHQWNPTFELAYWHWALGIAQKWRKRLEMAPDPHWEDVMNHLTPLTVRDGLYMESQSDPDTFSRPGQAVSHPCITAPLGILDGGMVDIDTMRRTLEKVCDVWNWDSTWGWDYPMLAMTAARLGDSKRAIDLLLMKVTKNTYLPNGHNFQMAGGLPLYLPGNGGFLYAVALMAAGWPGAPAHHAPGFPDDGQWVVRSEGLLPAL
jgi:hypothetical protein